MVDARGGFGAPWERKAGGFTREIEAFAPALMREMPIQ